MIWRTAREIPKEYDRWTSPMSLVEDGARLAGPRFFEIRRMDRERPFLQDMVGIFAACLMDFGVFWLEESSQYINPMTDTWYTSDIK